MIFVIQNNCLIQKKFVKYLKKTTILGYNDDIWKVVHVKWQSKNEIYPSFETQGRHLQTSNQTGLYYFIFPLLAVHLSVNLLFSENIYKFKILK